MKSEFILENLKYEDPSGTEVFPQGKLFRISYDAKTNKFQLKCFNRKDLEDIIAVYSDTNPNSFYMKQYGYSVPDRISIINTFGFFPVGFVFEIMKYIKLRYGTLNILAISANLRDYIRDKLIPIKKILKERNITSFEISNISEDSGRNKVLDGEDRDPFEFRDYQKSSIENLLFKGNGRGIIELGTSAGKSFIIGNFIYNILKHINQNYHCMILVPNKQLVYQMFNDLIDYGFDQNILTKFTAGLKKNEKYNPNASVIIANRQYVFTNMNLLPKIDVLFIDECHTTLAEKTASCIENLDAPIIGACTGTLPKRKYERWQLEGMYGQVVFSKPMTELQNEGYVTKIKLYEINIIDTVVENDRNYLFHTNPLRKYSPDENGYSEIPFNAAHEAEHEYYEKHYKDLYTPALEYISTFDENTLILFDRIEFGKRLTELSKDIFKDKVIHYIDGSIPVKERLEITAQFEKTGNNVLFAEFATFQVGISIKRLTNIAFVSSSKSFPRICQAIGRTLRLYKTKDFARVFDIAYNFRYSQRHRRERLKIYKDMYNKSPDVKKVIKI